MWAGDDFGPEELDARQRPPFSTPLSGRGKVQVVVMIEPGYS